MNRIKNILAVSAVVGAGLLSGCTSLDRYNQLDQSYAQLQKAYQADEVEIARLQGKLKVTIQDKILFKEGGYKLNAESMAMLDKMVPTLVGLKETKVLARGYTDSLPVGPGLVHRGMKTNLDLSTQRADSVASYLIEKGVDPAIISIQGMGDKNPVAPNDSRENRALNRRVEIILIGPGN